MKAIFLLVVFILVFSFGCTGLKDSLDKHGNQTLPDNSVDTAHPSINNTAENPPAPPNSDGQAASDGQPASSQDDTPPPPPPF